MDIKINSFLNSTTVRNELKESYLNALPFQHLVIDNVFDINLIKNIISDFEKVHHNSKYNDGATKGKFTCDDWEKLPQASRQLIAYLNSAPFVSFLSQITGIVELTSDPYLLGAGMHETMPGGYLKMHTDFNFHPRLMLDRRINALLYLNDGWEASWGGELLIATPDMSSITKIAPLNNRLVIFNTNDYSFHGQPDPHSFPLGNSRKSIAMYYYSVGRPSSEISYQKIGTTYKARYSSDLPLFDRIKEASRLLFGTKGRSN